MSAPCKSERNDKLAIVCLSALALIIIGGISWGAISERIPSDSQTLLGVIVGGLMMFARECLQAIRAFWQDQKTSKMTDQLANAGPPGTGDGQPPDAPAGTVEDPINTTVVNPPDEPVPVATTNGKKP